MIVPSFTGYQVLLITSFFISRFVCSGSYLSFLSQHDGFSSADNEKLSEKNVSIQSVHSVQHTESKRTSAAKLNCYKELILRHKENPCSKTFCVHYFDQQKLSFTHDHKVTGPSFESQVQVNGKPDVIRSLTHQIHTFRGANCETKKKARLKGSIAKQMKKKIIGIDGQFNRQVPNGITPSLLSSFYDAVRFWLFFMIMRQPAI